ncbi:hypothetical protein [Sodalis ligni]|uniref:Zinc ribbon protein n=1 Tax=Sodalis ligni TaxID=2697027 RepID=A0A4R1N748_9GAMM|nr:hypothetical protein [Sodalis ligni]TCL02339.1 hypothetical protein EZJ58_0344 [Sodalis ligni]
MKIIGNLLILIGIIWVFGAMNIDVSVASDMGGRVNNIGLMNERQNYVVIGCFIILYGLIMAMLSKNYKHLKQCHQCAELVKEEARKCRYCGSDLEVRINDNDLPKIDAEMLK